MSSADWPRVSIIIVSWNALSLLQQCLPSVVRTAYPDLEIILADNASSDGSAAWVTETFPQVRVVRHPENWAFCRGNNRALPHATGEVVVFLNNDVEVPPDWLNPLVRVLLNQPDVAAVQPKMLQHQQRDRFEYAGAAGGFLDWLGFPFARGRLFDTLEHDLGQYDDPRDVFWATGAALVVRRAALDTVGLFDERFWMHMEEIDLCWRLWRHGWRVRVEPSSVVYHIGGGSLPQGDARKTFLNYRNSLLMLYKNLPRKTWRRTFPLRAALDAVAFLRLLATGRLREAQAILQAYQEAHRMKTSFAASRPQRGDPVVLPSYRGSIVLDYFVRGRTRFSALPPERFTPLPTSGRTVMPRSGETSVPARPRT